MRKVFQSNVDQGTGDCARAVMASLFDKELEEMPAFFPDHTQSYEIVNYYKSLGYTPTFFNRKPKNYRLQSGELCPTIEEVAKFDGGINGYFYASVPSQTFENGSHAVVVDINLNIVHDPNQLALKLKPEDVVDIITVGDWYISLEGKFEKYDDLKID